MTVDREVIRDDGKVRMTAVDPVALLPTRGREQAVRATGRLLLSERRRL